MSVMLHIRMDEDLKSEAVAALDAMGLTASEAVRLLFHRIVAEQAFPLELKVPNAETVAAMEESREMMAARRRRHQLVEEDFGGLAEPDRQPEPGGPNAKTLAAMRESRAMMAVRRKR